MPGLSRAITGIIVDSTGQFLAAFALAGATGVSGLAAWLLVVPWEAPLAWPRIKAGVGAV